MTRTVLLGAAFLFAAYFYLKHLQSSNSIVFDFVFDPNPPIWTYFLLEGLSAVLSAVPSYAKKKQQTWHVPLQLKL